MKLPPNVRFNEENELLIWRPRLIVDEAVVNKIIAYIGAKEAMSRKPFNRFSDTTGVDGIDLNFRFVFHVALFRRLSCTGRPPVKSAILVPSLERARYSRMHALLTQGSPLKVRIFWNARRQPNGWAFRRKHWRPETKGILQEETLLRPGFGGQAEETELGYFLNLCSLRYLLLDFVCGTKVQ